MSSLAVVVVVAVVDVVVVVDDLVDVDVIVIVIVVVIVVVIVIVSVIISGCFVVVLTSAPSLEKRPVSGADFQLLLKKKKKKMCKVQVDTIGNVSGGRGRILSCVT